MRPLLEALGSPPLSPTRLGVLLPFLAVALTALVTGLHHRRLKARLGDEMGMWLYFALFFLLLAALPAGILCVAQRDPGRVLAAVGLREGNWRWGLPILALALPLAALISVFASKSPAMKEHYPFSKAACSSDGRFLAYELGYIVLYYTAWEFLYRGLLFFPLVDSLGFVAAASISTALSVLHHIGQPDSETAGALAGGYLLCAVAFLTNSIVYSIAIHATLGVSNDLFIYLRYHRGKASPV
jgi:membrane protease YdiL (CAAX protease family)